MEKNDAFTKAKMKADAAEMMKVPASTIRYYDKEGLLPFVRREPSGYRVFTEKDLATLRVIDCLKKTGMSIKDIRRFSKWLEQGDATLHQRYEMFLERRRAVEAQMAELAEVLKVINHKCQYYETAIAAGTEKIHMNDKPFHDDGCLGGFDEEEQNPAKGR